MSQLHALRGMTRRGATALVVVVGLALGATVLVPAAGADQVGDKQAEASKIADQLDALQSRQMDLSVQAERVGYEQDQAATAVDAAQTLLDQTNAELDTKREDVRRVAVTAYQNGNDSPELDAFLTSDANAGVQKRTYIESQTSSIRDAVDALGTAQQSAEDDKARLEDAQKAVDAKAAEYQQLKSANDKAVADAQALNSKVQGELQTLVEAEKARRAAEQKAIADRQAAAAKAAAPAVSTSTPRTSKSGGGGGVVVPSNPNPPPVGHGASGAIAAAMSRVGVGSYVWGAAGPVDFDCSGLVAWAYAQAGVGGLPHFSGAQYAMTTRISRDQLQPGDLVFWGAGGSEHVAIYIGGNSLVHAYSSGHGVGVTPLDGWWKPATGYGRLNY